MYADDIIQGANMVKKLQDMIDVLNEFCLKWGLQVNMSKTQIMVFRRGGEIKRYEKWYFRGKEITVVSSYKYLGILFSSQLSWNKAVYTLSMQAKKALAMFTKYSIKCGGFPTNVALQLFDKTIVPILLYASEIWGFRVYKAVEDVQIQFCKTLLGLPKQAANNAVVGDCGRYPLAVLCYRRCINYWLKIQEMNNARYVKNCYLMLKNLDERGKQIWASSIKALLCTHGFGVVWVEHGVGNKTLFLNEFGERLKDCYRQEWYRDIHNSSKLSIYCMFKSLLEPEKYLEYINIWKFRQAMARFRVSSHKLKIEKG